ncbi:MAG: YCF48-related protein [Dehalococcoidia bacterium]|nr:YCF48-related protein [Dehalococcoidia bacterium]
MATKSKKRQHSRRRQTWGLRMALWAALLAGTVGVIAFVLLSGGGGDGDGAPPSRFAAIHKFDTADYHSLAFDPEQPNVVLFGHHGGLQMSEDGGESWKKVADQQNWDAMNTVYDPFSPDTIYVAGHDVFFRSDDRGSTWEAVQSNLPGLDLHAFAASPATEGRLYAYSVGYGLYRSADGGSTWDLLTAQAPQGTNSILELPDGTLLLGATDQGILRSEDGGKTWAQSRTGIDVGAIFAVKGDPKGVQLYAGTDHGVYVSIDGGRTWRATALDDTWVIAVGVDPENPDTVLAINRNGQLYRSRDGGQTWG